MASFDLQPILTGRRVVLRPIVSADWDEMFAVARDDEIWDQHPVRDRHTASGFRLFFDTALAGGAAFSIIDRESRRIIGSTRYYEHDVGARQIAMGWTFLARRYWGQGFNGEIKRLMLDHAFCFLDTVIFYVAEANTRSLRAMEKLGAARRDERVARRQGDIAYPCCVFELRKRDWPRAE